jgi:uncharacterized membrane protein YdjX (TVP38/TMEM64 family)
VAVLVAVGFAGVTAWQLGLFELLGSAEDTADALRGLGVGGYALYVVAFALFAPFGVPGIAFVLPAAMIWPHEVAFVLSLTGATASAIVGFGFSRFLARDFVAARIPASIERRLARLEARPIRTIVVIRLFFVLFPPSHWALGVSNVRFPTYVWGSLLGYLVPMALLTWAGGGAMDWLVEQPAEMWRLVAVGIGGIVLLNWWNRRRRQREAAETQGAQAE